MKKILILALTASICFTACNKEVGIVDEHTNKGMVLHATVEQTIGTRAAITESQTGRKWQFAFKVGDKIRVTHDSMSPGSIIFTKDKDGEDFTSVGIDPVYPPCLWYAYYPYNPGPTGPYDEVPLTNQTGSLDGAASKYALAGVTAEVSNGQTGLRVTMSPQVAILRIVNNKGPVAINVKNSQNTWVKGLKAINGKAEYSVISAESIQILLSATTKGIYYIAVPAGVQLSVKDGDKMLRSTKKEGLEAGKCYQLTIAATSTNTCLAVNANAGVQRNCVSGVRLWDGGPLFATVNVGVTDGRAEKTGGYYVWGGSIDKGNDYKSGNSVLTGDDDTATKLWGGDWRMPEKKDFEDLISKCSIRWVEDFYGSNGLLITGHEDYSGNSIFLPAAGSLHDTFYGLNTDCRYWTSSPSKETDSYRMKYNTPSELPIIDDFSRSGWGFSVRAVNDGILRTRGTAIANIDGKPVEVNWTQLWEGGPKFAEFNVGINDITSASYGYYYSWGKTSYDNCGKSGSEPLSGDDDTATKLWGANWRMPTSKEWSSLLTQCEIRFIDYDYMVDSGFPNLVCIGKGAYSENIIYLPAHGIRQNGSEQGWPDNRRQVGGYWSSTPTTKDDQSLYFFFSKNSWALSATSRNDGNSVRAVLVENFGDPLPIFDTETEKLTEDEFEW